MILLSYIEIAKIHIIFYIKSFLLHFFLFFNISGLGVRSEFYPQIFNVQSSTFNSQFSIILTIDLP